MKKFVTTITNTIISSCSLFCIIFGNVGEEMQLQNNNFKCTTKEENCKDLNLYNYSNDCCTTKEYNNVYHILSLIGSILAFGQIYYFTKHLFYKYISLKIFDLSFLFKSYIIHASFITPFLGSMYVYQYLQYNVFFCHSNSWFCENPPSAYPIVHNIYLSFITILAIYLFCQICCIILFFYIFFTKRFTIWKDICSLEKTIFHIKFEMETKDHKIEIAKIRNIKNFVKKWRNIQDDEIEEIMHKRAKNIFYNIKKNIQNNCIENEQKNKFINSNNKSTQNVEMQTIDSKNYKENTIISFPSFPSIESENNSSISNDTSHMSPILYSDFNDKVYKHRSEEQEELWKFLTHDHLYDIVTIDSIEDAYYKLFFLRKEFANCIFTDLVVVSSLFKYLSAALYPAGLIAIARIFGYQNSFGEGVDLFKTYLLGLSFIGTKMIDSINFMLLMITDRPFNIGDILKFENNTFKVDHFDFSHSYLTGPFCLIIPNIDLISGKVVNLTKENITDSLQIYFPINTSDEKANQKTFMKYFEEYMNLYPRDIKHGSIRCGWVGNDQSSGTQKVMQCNWRYNFKIHNRSRLNQTRTRINDFIISKCSNIISEYAMKIHLAGGGAYNDIVTSYKEKVL